MTVTLLTASRCPVCGYSNRGRTWRSVRVNKKSLRTTAPGLMVAPQCCVECGCPDVRDGALYGGIRYRLDDDSAAKVDAYRARRWAG